MTKELQDLTWACAPKEFRDSIKHIYNRFNTATCLESFKEARDLLKALYGHHNLTSSTEPEEMLMVERKKVIEIYNPEYDGETLYELFGDKCLPDKEQPKPKFSLNEIVRVISHDKYGTVGRIIKVDEEDDGFFYTLNGVKDWRFVEKNLEPYTEENETIKMKTLEESLPGATKIIDENFDYLVGIKDNMEEKELNLCELLKDCEGEKFYLLSRGYMTLAEITRNHPIDSCFITLVGKGTVHLYQTGKEVNNEAIVILYPSRALYEKYPLDAYSAWMEWKESRDKKTYMQVNVFSEDGDVLIDEAIVNITQKQVEQIVTEVNEVLQEFHEKSIEK